MPKCDGLLMIATTLKKGLLVARPALLYQAPLFPTLRWASQSSCFEGSRQGSVPPALLGHGQLLRLLSSGVPPKSCLLLTLPLCQAGGR